MPFAENKGVRLYWQEQGSGTPIVLVMGHLYTSAMWYPILPALAAKHRVIVFDNRGVGKSDGTATVTVGEMVDDTLAVMDAAGVERAHVFGVSMGGGIVLELAMRHPERVISLIPGCTCILTADKPRSPGLRRLVYYVPQGFLKFLLRHSPGNRGYGSAATPEAIARDEQVFAKDHFTVRGALAQSRAIENYVTTKEAVAALDVPTLVLHGKEDSVVPFAYGVEIAETIPGSRLVAFEGAGHNFLVAAREQTEDAVLGFIREVEARGAA